MIDLRRPGAGIMHNFTTLEIVYNDNIYHVYVAVEKLRKIQAQYVEFRVIKIKEINNDTIFSLVTDGFTYNIPDYEFYDIINYLGITNIIKKFFKKFF
jgi:hypothetical protein